MCITSNVYDHWGPRIPDPYPNPYPTIYPQIYPTVINNPPQITSEEIEELKELITQFKEAIQIAKRLDELMNQPDCVDPDKAKLEQRVKKIEDWIEKIKQ